MRVCPSCKTQAAEGAKFCRKCGGALAPEKAAVPQAVAKRQLLEARIKAEPQNAALLEEYGDFLFSVGLVEEALVQLHTVAEIGRGNEALLLKIAEGYRTIQQWDNAAAQIELALEFSPDKPALYERLANVLLEGGRTEDALAQLHNLSNMKACQLPLRRLSILKGIPKTRQFNHRYPKWNVWFQAPGYWRFCGTQNVALHCGGYRSNKRTG